jgi:MFS family permease
MNRGICVVYAFTLAGDDGCVKTPEPNMNRNVLLLALSQALAMTVVSLMLSSSALIGVDLAASPGWATLPLAVQYLVTVLALHPLARLSARRGRRPVFVASALIGAVGLALAMAGVATRSFALFALAGLGVGVLGAASQFYRFAAAEAVPPSQRGQAISLTLAGGVLAAFLGPMLARHTRELAATPFVASFAALVGVALLAALLGSRLTLPTPRPAPAGRAPRRLVEIARHGRFRLAVAGGAIAYGAMGLLMTATPLAMLCARHDFDATAAVIQWHLVAMFAPGFVSGALIRRFGAPAAMFGGGALNLAGIAWALGGDAIRDFGIALALVGVGWNFLYVGATTLLTDTCRDEERPTVQAFNDSAVFLTVTLATLFAGRLVDGLGWERVNLLAAVPVALLMVAIAVGGWRRGALASAR